MIKITLRELPPVTPPKEVTIVTDFETAQMIHDVMGKVTGHTAKSRRKLVDAVYFSLEEAGFTQDPSDLGGSLNFEG